MRPDVILGGYSTRDQLTHVLLRFHLREDGQRLKVRERLNGRRAEAHSREALPVERHRGYGVGDKGSQLLVLILPNLVRRPERARLDLGEQLRKCACITRARGPPSYERTRRVLECNRKVQVEGFGIDLSHLGRSWSAASAGRSNILAYASSSRNS